MNFHIFCAVLIVVNEWVSAFLEQVLGVARPAESVRPASQDLVWGLPLPKSEGQKASNVWLDSRYWKTWLVQIAIRQLAWSISIVICGAIVFVGILFLLIVASFFQ